MKSLKLTENNLNLLKCGEYAIFVNGELKDIRIVDNYCKKEKSTWDYYTEFGTTSNKELVEQYSKYRNVVVCNVKDIIAP
jgi:hypothetical protein